MLSFSSYHIELKTSQKMSIKYVTSVTHGFICCVLHCIYIRCVFSAQSLYERSIHRGKLLLVITLKGRDWFKPFDSPPRCTPKGWE